MLFVKRLRYDEETTLHCQIKNLSAVSPVSGFVGFFIVDVYRQERIWYVQDHIGCR